MNKEILEKEIVAGKETITKLEEILENTKTGLEVNKFVIEKLEEELKNA